MTNPQHTPEEQLREQLTIVDGLLATNNCKELQEAVDVLSRLLDACLGNGVLANGLVQNMNVVRVFREILKYVERGPLEQSRWSALGQKLNEILVGAPKISESPEHAPQKPVTVAE